MSDPIVSIIIPTYNYGRFVGEAVDSALAQNYRDREVIVVDDGSTDDTRERLRGYEGRIRYLFQQNQGLSAARNTGIRAARGQFIGLLDSDDIWHPRKLEIQMRCLADRPDLALLATDLTSGPQGQWPIVDECMLSARPVTVEALSLRTPFGPSTVLIRRACLDQTGLFDTRLRSVEDRDMWIRLAARFSVAMLPAPLCWYRLHASSMSRAAARMEENELRVLTKNFAEIASLRRRPLLRRKALSYALYSAAYMHREAGNDLTAVCRLIRSLVLWPAWYRRGEVRMPLARLKLLATLLGRLARGARTPREIPATGGTTP